MGDARTAFQLCGSSEDVAETTMRRLLEAADEAILARGRFRLVLAGGRTPLAAYTLLAHQVSDWDRWHIFFGDERCLPAADPDRNSQSAMDAWLCKVPIPAANVHPIRAELGAEAAALSYERIVCDGAPFDLVLLGMGEDGHTASLFPGHEIPGSALVMPVHEAPKPPPDRVSLTPRALAASRRMLILVTGSGKRDALARWRRGADLPIAQVAAAGDAEVLMDPEAAGE